MGDAGLFVRGQWNVFRQIERAIARKVHYSIYDRIAAMLYAIATAAFPQAIRYEFGGAALEYILVLQGGIDSLLHFENQPEILGA
jgi:hypothetical protein